MMLRNLPIWKGREIHLKPLNGGITNINFKIKANGNYYVARLGHSQNKLLGIDKEKEFYNTNLAFSLGIGPKAVGVYLEQNLLVTEFIPGEACTPKEVQENIPKLARILFKLHHSRKKFKDKTNIIEGIRTFIDISRKKKSWLPEDIGVLLDQLEQLEKIICPFSLNYPCHLDLMIENIIRTPEGIKLIDWEYAANSDFRFDLAMLSVKGKFSVEQDEELLQAYDETAPTPAFQAMKAIVFLREASWGILQNAISLVPFNYKKYAIENLQQFRSMTEKILKANELFLVRNRKS